jgi:hypothetical protein
MNILPTEFRVLGGMWCSDVVALNASVGGSRQDSLQAPLIR